MKQVTLQDILEAKLAGERKQAPKKNAAAISLGGTLGYRTGSLAGRAVLGGEAAYASLKMGWEDRKVL